MRELRIDGTLILAVDHGYGNIKTANTVFSNGFVERDTNLQYVYKNEHVKKHVERREK